MCGFYQRFVADYATVAAPPTDLMQKGKYWAWLPVQQHAFETLKARLLQAPVLIHHDHTKHYMLYTDVTDVGVGATLGCSGRTVMTHGAVTKSAWDVPGALPGSGLHVPSPVVSKQSLFSDFIWGAIPLGSVLVVVPKTRRLSVYTLALVFSPRSAGVLVVLVSTSSFLELARARLTVRQNFGLLSIQPTRKYLLWCFLRAMTRRSTVLS